MKVHCSIVALFLALLSMDLWRSDLRHRPDLLGANVLRMDWRSQWLMGLQSTEKDHVILERCLPCRLGRGFQQALSIMAQDDLPTPPTLETPSALGEWAFSYGMALAHSGQSMGAVRLNPPPGFLFMISGYSFYEMTFRGADAALDRCKTDFTSDEQRACYFGAGAGGAANPERLAAVRRAPAEFIAGYLDAKDPNPCADGRHPLFCLPHR